MEAWNNDLGLRPFANRGKADVSRQIDPLAPDISIYQKVQDKASRMTASGDTRDAKSVRNAYGEGHAMAVKAVSRR